MAAAFTSKRYRVEDVDADEFCFQQGCTDGLPVVPPTEDRVTMMLAAARLDPKQEIAFITNRSVSVTAEKVAINAVMAGCRPEYMAVVVAAVEGIGDPAWSYHGPGTSTGGAAVLVIVNGPITRELDINAGDNLFGPGWRANLAIGRALRLVMRNVCGSLPGLLDRGTLGHPGKLS
ncbi:MAG TPA: UGSC family (seleno)protein, partial [Kofleriaceae bacterium]|nr:UGSC family (seleno)protein [Kofleriaceae bacterium]